MGKKIKIVDRKDYNRYWWGKTPKMKRAFEDWCSSDLTAKETSHKHKVAEASLHTHKTSLRRKGVIKT